MILAEAESRYTSVAVIVDDGFPMLFDLPIVRSNQG